MTANDLIELRTRMHWTQIEAAKHLGCSPRSIVNWEAGKPIPGSIALAASAILMNLPPYGSGTVNIDMQLLNKIKKAKTYDEKIAAFDEAAKNLQAYCDNLKNPT